MKDYKILVFPVCLQALFIISYTHVFILVKNCIFMDPICPLGCCLSLYARE